MVHPIKPMHVSPIRPVRSLESTSSPALHKSIPWLEVLIAVVRRQDTSAKRTASPFCLSIPFFPRVPHFFPGYAQLCELFSLRYFPRAIQASSPRSRRHIRPEFPFSSDQCWVCAMGILCQEFGHGRWKKYPPRVSAVHHSYKFAANLFTSLSSALSHSCSASIPLQAPSSCSS